MQERARHVKSLLHAARISLHFFIAASVQADHIEQIGNPLFGDIGVDAVETGKVTQVIYT
jgi:hypothetical protein